MARAGLGDKAQTGNGSTSISSVQPLFAHVLPALKRKREAGLLLLRSIGLVMVCHDNIKRVSASVKLEKVPFQTPKKAKPLSANRGIQAQARLCQPCMLAAHNKGRRLPSPWIQMEVDQAWYATEELPSPTWLDIDPACRLRPNFENSQYHHP